MLFVLAEFIKPGLNIKGVARTKLLSSVLKAKDLSSGLLDTLRANQKGSSKVKERYCKDGSKVPTADQSWWDPPHRIGSGLNLVAALLRCRVGELTFLGLSHQIS